MKDRLKKLLFPVNRKSLIRLAVVVFTAYVLFRFICIPVFINGESMSPTYGRYGFNFCWSPRYLFSSPQRQDIVAIRLAGKKIMFLKRIVAFEGETVEFRAGKLFVNGKELYEPYVKYSCDWELKPRKVSPGKVYVIGDNRSMSIERHEFGETSMERIMGGPLW